MVKLIFPENDIRSNGKPFNPKRPWLKQGAQGKIIKTSHNVAYVKFVGSKDTDIVSPDFLK